MPRAARLRIPGLPVHIVHRGVNRSTCFFRHGDYQRYLDLLEESATRFSCQVHAYTLMTNHVHLLVSPAAPEDMSWMMKRLAQGHAQYINRSCGRTGHFWEGRFHSSFVDSEAYLLRCYRYVEMNPVRAGLARHPAEYVWTSFRANGLGYPSSLVAPHPAYLSLGADPASRQRAYRELFDQGVADSELEEIRAALCGGRLLRGDCPQRIRSAEREVGTVP